MNTILLLAMHGAPPQDFPRAEMMELFDLHHRLEHAHGPGRGEMEARFAALDAKMRTWPRTPQNDPFWAGSVALAEALTQPSGLPVMLGFNEFCAPSLEEALDQAAAQADEVLIVTPMMTRGGEHAERDIPQAIQAARARHPEVKFTYLWPFETPAIAAFLAEQVNRLR